MEVIMKALKIALLALFATFTVVSFAQQNDRVHPQFHAQMVKITTIEKSSALGMAILKQVDPDVFLNEGERSRTYIAVIRFNRGEVKVYGTYWQWFRFLKLHYRDWPSVGEGKSPGR
jgi:hypothetical protein